MIDHFLCLTSEPVFFFYPKGVLPEGEKKGHFHFFCDQLWKRPLKWPHQKLLKSFVSFLSIGSALSLAFWHALFSEAVRTITFFFSFLKKNIYLCLGVCRYKRNGMESLIKTHYCGWDLPFPKEENKTVSFLPFRKGLTIFSPWLISVNIKVNLDLVW